MQIHENKHAHVGQADHDMSVYNGSFSFSAALLRCRARSVYHSTHPTQKNELDFAGYTAPTRQ